MKTPLIYLLQIILGVSVHNTHVVNTFAHFMPEVPDQPFFSVASGVCDLGREGYGPYQMSLCTLHYATCVYEGVVAHVSGCEGFSHCDVS